MGSGGSKTDKKHSKNSNANAGQKGTQEKKETKEDLPESNNKVDKQEGQVAQTSQQSTPQVPVASSSQKNDTLKQENAVEDITAQTRPPHTPDLTSLPQEVINNIPPTETKSTDIKTEKPKAKVSEEQIIPLEPEDQRKFDDVMSTACLLLKPESVYKKVTKTITKLTLPRALPLHMNVFTLLSKFSSLQHLDLSGNEMGPQCFRSICLAMSMNSSILSLNLANSKTDTDSAECLGLMVEKNKTLEYLNVSSNYFGLDYFSRCVGPALKVNNSLQTLRAESIGTTDIKIFAEGLKENSSLTEIDFSSNCVRDGAALGKCFGEILQRPNCVLQSLALASCEMNQSGLEILRDGLSKNTSLTELNINGNDFGTLDNILKYMVVAGSHPSMKTISIDSAKVKDKSCTGTDAADLLKTDVESNLQIVSLNNSNLSDSFWEVLATLFKGKQLPLVDLVVGSNEELTPACLEHILSLSCDEDSTSTIRRLNISLMTKTDGLAAELSKGCFPLMNYLNIRKCRVTQLDDLTKLYCGVKVGLSTLVLDGIKLASTDILGKLLADAIGGSLNSLSVAGCSLTAADLSPLYQGLKKGLQLQMLKLSTNRLEDQGVIELVEALLSNKTHPLAVLDLSFNSITNEAAVSLSTLFTHKKHKSQIHSLNVSQNNIGKEGLVSLAGCVGGKAPLRTLFAQSQADSIDEQDMELIFSALAKGLGFSIKKTGEVINEGCSDIPNLPDGLLVNLTNLGGSPGMLGKMMDSPRILTDYKFQRLPFLSFQDVLEISSYIRNCGSDVCLLSNEEWKMITGANKPTTDVPSWLELADNREKAIYLSNLPGNATLQKIESILEMEADCNVDETCLMKDPVTRAINGVGWTLLSDTESVTRAINYYNQGEARIFGQAFMMSKIKVKVDDEASAETALKAREDQERRAGQRRLEEREHRHLIQRTAEETWKRHAYRLAHPAYADGRIW